MTESADPAPRDVESLDVDGQRTQFLRPDDQAREDRRQAERRGLRRRHSLASFFRMFSIRTQDRP